MSKNLFEYSKAITSNSLALVITSLIGFLSLIAFGWLMASHKDSITILSSLWGWLYQLSQIALGFGTFLGAVVAVKALGEWKHQFQFEKGFEYLVDFSNSLDNLIISLNDYFDSIDKYKNEMFLEKETQNTYAQIEPLGINKSDSLEHCERQKKKFLDERVVFKKAYRKALIFHPDIVPSILDINDMMNTFIEIGLTSEFKYMNDKKMNITMSFWNTTQRKLNQAIRKKYGE